MIFTWMVSPSRQTSPIPMTWLDAVKGCQVLVLVSPSQVMRPVLKQLKAHLADDCLLVSAAKGIENDTLMTMSEVLQEVLGTEIKQRSAFLSGPSFAREVAEEQPTAVAVAAENLDVATRDSGTVQY